MDHFSIMKIRIAITLLFVISLLILCLRNQASPSQQALASFAAPSAGLAVTRISNDSAQTTNVNFGTAPTAGDLIIVMAHRDGSTTPPTKVTGYTTIDNTTGANTNSAILAFKFSDGTETGTGTWTNATSVTTLIYRNAGLGGWAKTRTAGTTSPMTYGTLTMQNTSGTSWVAGMGATKGSTDVGTNAPSGMTTRTSATDIASFDTGAGVASWSAQTAAVNGTPSGTISYTLEILAIPSGQLLWTFIQHATAMSFSGTTASVTLTQSVGSEPHVLVVSTQYTGGEFEEVSIDKGGTLISLKGSLGLTDDLSGGPHGYVIGTTTATSPITVTFAGSTTGNTSIWEVAYTGVGTPSLDFENRLVSSGGTSVVGPAFTMTGGNDLIIQTASTSQNVTAIASPYNSPTGYSIFTSGNGFAGAFNQTSAPAATWTISSGGSNGMSAVGFGLSPTAFLTQLFCDFEASTDGTTCTGALLKSSTKGWTGGIWTTGGTGAAMKFASAGSRGLTNSITRLNDGATVSSGAGSLGVQFLTSTVQSYLKFDTTTGIGSGANAINSTSFSAGIWFWSDIAATNTVPIDVFAIITPGGVGFANCKFLGNGGGTSRTFELETAGGTGTNRVDVSSSTWYWLTVQYNLGSDCVLKVYEADGTTLKGTNTETHSGTGMPGYVAIGQFSSNTPTTGFVINFDSLKIDPTGTFPLLP